jgi:rRNA biogenesis protein RRP5
LSLTRVARYAQQVGRRTLHVLVADGVRGTVALEHMADTPVRDPSTRFRVRQLLECRVLDISTIRNRVFLTAKPSLVDSPLPIVASLADAQAGMLTHGVVSRVVAAGAFVNLYGSVSGFVPLREMAVGRAEQPSSICKVGDVVRCRVLKLDERSSRVLLSFITSDEARRLASARANHVTPHALAAAGVVVGSFVASGTVESIVDEKISIGFDIERTTDDDDDDDNNNNDGANADDGKSSLPTAHVVATLLRTHLRDTDNAADVVVHVGDTMHELLVLRIDGTEKRAHVTLTRKPSLIAAARANELPSCADATIVGRSYAAYVTSVTAHAVFVAFAGSLSGYACRRRACSSSFSMMWSRSLQKDTHRDES